jgi:adenylate cyclase
MTIRRLAAILAADVVGFSSMMERDEKGTLRRIRKYFKQPLARSECHRQPGRLKLQAGGHGH